MSRVPMYGTCIQVYLAACMQLGSYFNEIVTGPLAERLIYVTYIFHTSPRVIMRIDSLNIYHVYYTWVQFYIPVRATVK